MDWISHTSHAPECTHSPTSPWVCIHPPLPVFAFTHLSLCMMAACANRPCIVVKRSSSRVDRRCAIPSCTCRLPENMMVFRNASTSLTISSLGWDNKGITWEKQGIIGQSTLQLYKTICTVWSTYKPQITPLSNTLTLDTALPKS